MSYCRWSSDDWSCDVYVYESVGDFWSINVARHRYVGDMPEADKYWSDGKLEKFFVAHQQQMDFLETAEMVAIGLSHDGESFEVDSPQEAADILTMLSEEGYNVPQYAIDALRKEAEEA